MPNREASEQRLTEWAANNARRDELVRAALIAGVTPNRIHTLTGIARTTIYRIKERPMSVTTTVYGNWNNRVQPYDQNLESSVANALGDYASDYDIDAIATDWRAAINDALPENVTLAGEEFIGPCHDEDATWGADLEDEDGRLDIKAIVESVDFWAIAARHETKDD